MKKYIILSVLSLLIFGSIAHAQNYSLSSDLSIGARGSDVTALQSFLINKGFSIPAIVNGSTGYGYFGAQTQSALAAYQASVGLEPSGVLDIATRNRMSGINTSIIPATVIPATIIPVTTSYAPTNYNSSYIPVINGIDAPTALSVNQVGTWKVRATDPYNGTLTYNVNWGDGLTNAYTDYATNSYMQQVSQAASFSHSYSYAGTFTVRFTVRNNFGQVAESTVTVQVGNIYGGGSGGNGNGGNAGPLHIITPNGGENLQKGTVYNITWTAPYYFRATSAELRLLRYNSCTGICPMIAYAPYIITSNISINQNSFAWRVGDYNTSSQVPDGQYTIQICEIGGNNCDSSDSPFTIYTSTSYPNYYPDYQNNSTYYPNNYSTYPTSYSVYPYTQYQDLYPSNSVYQVPNQVPNCPTGYSCTPTTY